MCFGKKRAGMTAYICHKMKMSAPCRLEVSKLWPTIRKGTLGTTRSGLTAHLYIYHTKYSIVKGKLKYFCPL